LLVRSEQKINSEDGYLSIKYVKKLKKKHKKKKKENGGMMMMWYCGG
jgi:hypothetical protein